MHRPFVWLTTDEADLGGQLSLGANATLLSSHAEGPRAAAGDTTYASQTSRSTSSHRVSPPSAREPTARVGRHRQTIQDSDSDSSHVFAATSATKQVPTRRRRGALLLDARSRCAVSEQGVNRLAVMLFDKTRAPQENLVRGGDRSPSCGASAPVGVPRRRGFALSVVDVTGHLLTPRYWGTGV